MRYQYALGETDETCKKLHAVFAYASSQLLLQSSIVPCSACRVSECREVTAFGCPEHEEGRTRYGATVKMLFI